MPGDQYRNRILKGNAVQRIGWILAVLLAIGWVASEIPLQKASSNDRPSVQYRLAADRLRLGKSGPVDILLFHSPPGFTSFLFRHDAVRRCCLDYVFILPGKEHLFIAFQGVRGDKNKASSEKNQT